MTTNPVKISIFAFIWNWSRGVLHVWLNPIIDLTKAQNDKDVQKVMRKPIDYIVGTVTDGYGGLKMIN